MLFFSRRFAFPLTNLNHRLFRPLSKDKKMKRRKVCTTVIPLKNHSNTTLYPLKVAKQPLKTYFEPLTLSIKSVLVLYQKLASNTAFTA